VSDWELRVRERLVAIQSGVLDAYLSLFEKHMDGELTYGQVHSKLVEIRNSVRTVKVFLGDYLSKNTALAEVFNEFLSSIETQCAYYSGKAETGFALPITHEDWERLRSLAKIWKDWVSDMITCLAPPVVVVFKVIDPLGNEHHVSHTLEARMKDLVEETLPRWSGRVTCRVGDRQYGPGYLEKSLFELGVEPGLEVRLERAGEELIPKTSFTERVAIEGERTVEVRETFIIGRIRGEQLGIRRFPRSMKVWQLLDEIKGDVEGVFPASAGDWIRRSCPRYVSRVHAVVYQRGSSFYLLDVSLNGTLLITDGGRSYIRPGREEFDSVGRITPYKLSSRNTVQLFGTSLNILIGGR
jgi:hypothetical protein